ncbi:MAG: TRAP transporter large permease [Candidatus Rokubacteria bacterium]|nr:TRAP transporter large permease [Candidatus Rokubacteria bacterium]
MLLLLTLGVPVYASIGAVGFVGYWVLEGQAKGLSIVGLVSYSRVAVYAFSVVPLFIFMGNVLFASGLGQDVYAATRRWMGRLPGGLAQATVGASALFGAACGSSVATAATFAKIAIPEMLRYGYAKKLAAASVVAAGTLAVMIPPSITMVLYALITDQSIAKLLIAGILPGILNAVIYMVLISLWAKRYPQDAPRLAVPWSWTENLTALKGVWAVLAIGLVVLGGIYSGIGTPTEAGALGAFAALVLAVTGRRLPWRQFVLALVESVKTTVMIHVILLSAFIFGYFMAVTLLPQKLAALLTSLPLPPLGVLVAIMIVYIVLGAFMDMLSIMFLTVPVIFPTILALGFDPIWFGVLMVMVIEMGMVTPPFGINLFVVKGTVPDVSLNDIIAGIGPFVVAQAVTLALYIAFPQIALFLPNTMLGP